MLGAFGSTRTDASASCDFFASSLERHYEEKGGPSYSDTGGQLRPAAPKRAAGHCWGQRLRAGGELALLAFTGFGEVKAVGALVLQKGPGIQQVMLTFKGFDPNHMHA